MHFVLVQIIAHTLAWLVDTAILNRAGSSNLSLIGELQQKALQRLLFAPSLSALHGRNQVMYNGQVYTIQNLFADLHKAV